MPKPAVIIEGLVEARTVGEAYEAVCKAFAHGKLDAAHRRLSASMSSRRRRYYSSAATTVLRTRIRSTATRA